MWVIIIEQLTLQTKRFLWRLIKKMKTYWGRSGGGPGGGQGGGSRELSRGGSRVCINQIVSRLDKQITMIVTRINKTGCKMIIPLSTFQNFESPVGMEINVDMDKGVCLINRNNDQFFLVWL